MRRESGGEKRRKTFEFDSSAINTRVMGRFPLRLEVCYHCPRSASAAAGNRMAMSLPFSVEGGWESKRDARNLPSQRLSESITADPCQLISSRPTMSLFTDNGELYPGVRLSVSQLLDAAKRKLKGSRFDERCVCKSRSSFTESRGYKQTLLSHSAMYRVDKALVTLTHVCQH